MATLRLLIDARQARQGASEFDAAAGKVTRSAGIASRSVASLVAAIVSIETARRGLQALISFERSLIGVQKTTDLSSASLQQFGRDILALSVRTPIAADRLNEFAEAAGQLGVRGADNLLAFAETIGRLDFATVDFKGSDAASTLARILDLTGEGAGNVRELANVLVALGNQMAATEGQIGGIAEELAAASVGFNVSSANLVALAAAFRATGGEAEASRTAFLRIMTEINEATLGANDSLQTFADLAGLSAEEFKQAFRSDSFSAFVAVMRGLGDQGDRVGLVLDRLGLEGVRVGVRLQPLAQEFRILARAIEIQQEELEANNALMRESDKVFDSFGGQVERLGNAISALPKLLFESTGPLADLVGAAADAVSIASGLGVDLEKTSDSAIALGNALRFAFVTQRSLVEDGFALITRESLKTKAAIDDMRRSVLGVDEAFGQQADVFRATELDRSAEALEKRVESVRDVVGALEQAITNAQSVAARPIGEDLFGLPRKRDLLARGRAFDDIAKLEAQLERARTQLVLLEERLSTASRGETVVRANREVDLFIERVRETIGDVPLSPRMQEAERAIRDLGAAIGESFTEEHARDIRDVFRELEAAERLKQLGDDIGFGIVQPLEDAILAGRELRDVLRQIGLNIAGAVLRNTITNPLAQSISQLIQSAQGNAFSAGNVIPFAAGGILGGPSVFPLAGGRLGLAGEAGPEAVMPLARTPTGDLGVKTTGDGSATVVAAIREQTRMIRALMGTGGGLGLSARQAHRRN